MADGEILALRQEMTLSRESFLRSLPGAVENVAFRIHDSEIRYRDRDRAWRIVLAALPDLKLGMITLPRQRVEIFLTGYDDAGARQFLERFELYFRRAGG